MRIPEKNPVKKLTLLKPEGSRQAGRPKLRWLDGVEEGLRTLGIRGWRRRALQRLGPKTGCNSISSSGGGSSSSSSSSSSSKKRIGEYYSDGTLQQHSLSQFCTS